MSEQMPRRSALATTNVAVTVLATFIVILALSLMLLVISNQRLTRANLQQSNTNIEQNADIQVNQHNIDMLIKEVIRLRGIVKSLGGDPGTFSLNPSPKPSVSPRP